MTTPPPELVALRARIDELDDQIVALLAARYALLADVVKAKGAHNVPHRVPARVEEVLARNEKNGTAQGLPPGLARAIWGHIIDAAHEYEKKFLST
jgi:isochorismate pyruvate lyase